MENEKLRQSHFNLNEQVLLLESQNNEYARRESESKQLVSSLYQRVALLEDQNAELSLSLDCTQEKLNASANELGTIKRAWGETIAEQREKIGALSEVNLLHEKQIDEFKCAVKELTEQNARYKSGSEGFSRSQQRMIERLNKLKATKDALYKNYLQLQAQSYQFFNALIAIRDKLDSKTATVFEDFVVVSEIKLSNEKLKDSLRQKEKQIKGLRTQVDQLLNDKQSQINALKTALSQVQSECTFMSRAFEFKEEEIGVYKRAIRQKSPDHFETFRNLTNLQNLASVELKKENIDSAGVELLRHENQLLRQKILWLSGFSKEAGTLCNESPRRARHLNTVGKENVCKKIKFI